MKKNLILGAIKGYSYDKLDTFVSSIKTTSFNGDVVFLEHGISEETKKTLAKNGVLTQGFAYRSNGALNSWSRFWPYIKPFLFNGLNPFSRYILKKIVPLQTARFLHSKDFLKKNREKYKNVLLTDIRDVYFQADPFTVDYSKVQLYEEFLKIDQEQLYNSVWIKTLYGDAALKEMSQYKIICCGTILGPVDEMILLLDKFEKTLYQSIDMNTVSVGTDQGTFNYMSRKYYSKHVEFNPYGTGAVLTVSNIDHSVYQIKDNKVLYQDGSIIPVVHQYDRSEEISKVLVN